MFKNVNAGSRTSTIQAGYSCLHFKTDQMAEANPIELQEYLGGLEYPANKEQIRERAREEGADKDILDLIDRLPDQKYKSPVDVSKAVGDLD